MSAPHAEAPDRLREVVAVFLRLGVTAFGGPAAHTALMHHELVRRRGWLGDQRFADLMGATNLVPGPNSTELAIHLGHERAGWRGLLAAGALFILPGALAVTGVAWAYVEYGDAPALRGVLYGVVPVMIAIIVHALASLVRTVLSTGPAVLVASGALAAYLLLGVHELVVLAAGAAVMLLLDAVRRRGSTGLHALVWPLLAATGEGRDDLLRLFLGMLRIGAVLYGSGYVLLAFLEGEFVDRLGWLTQAQLVDAIAAGQVTPGPVFTTATFVGYLVAGLPGAFLATVAIFLPSFVFVGLLTRVSHRLRSSRTMAAVLDGVNAAALALMAGVTVHLAGTAVVDVLTAALAAGTLLLLWRTRLNSTWLIAAGAAVGVLSAYL